MITPFAKCGGTEQPDCFCDAFHINGGRLSRACPESNNCSEYERAARRRTFSIDSRRSAQSA